MLRSSGTTPLRHARLAPMPRISMPGSARQRATDGGEVGRHDPLPEVAELHHQHDSVHPAGARGGVGEQCDDLDLGRGSSRRRPRRPARPRSACGERISTIGAPMPAARSRSMFSMRESPSATAPAASSTRPSAGSPQQGLGDRGDRDAARGGAANECLGVPADPVEVDLDPGRGHRRSPTGSARRAGNAPSTMSTRPRRAGRARRWPGCRAPPRSRRWRPRSRRRSCARG